MYEHLGALNIVLVLATGTKDYPGIVKTKPRLTLIISAPSPLQDGLLALMKISSSNSAGFVAEVASLWAVQVYQAAHE